MESKTEHGTALFLRRDLAQVLPISLLVGQKSSPAEATLWLAPGTVPATKPVDKRCWFSEIVATEPQYYFRESISQELGWGRKMTDI